MTLQESADKIIFDAMHPERGEAQRLVCSWCGLVMRGGPPTNISHGICTACQKEMEK